MPTGTEVRMQFFRDQATQRVEAIVTFAPPVAFCSQKLFGSKSPHPPFLSLGDHRLASILEPLDPGSQRVTFLLQFIDPPGLVRDALFSLRLIGSDWFPRRPVTPQCTDRRIMPAVRL